MIGIYETIRAENYTPQNFSTHLERLTKSANELNLKIPFNNQEIEAQIQSELTKQQIPNARIRITLEPTNFSITCTALAPIPAGPHKIITLKLERKTPHLKPPDLTITNLAQTPAKEDHAIEAILINSKGFATEGSISNFFIFSNQTLITNQENCLIGTMQQLVIQTAKQLKIPLKIRPILATELETADEIFITNAIKQILPIHFYNNQSLKSNQIATQLIQYLQFDKVITNL
jgi:branched-subunit amino acid aminotransferase/4-amino-4-deoxychorismate lyase